MKHRSTLLIALLVVISSAGYPGTLVVSPAAAADAVARGSEHPPATVVEWAEGAMLFDGLGEAHRAVTTSSPDAQSYFDQGLRFMWSFNHDEATRSFAKAAQIDPQCASCFWGLALTVGPNYNLPFMKAERASVAFDALGRAERNAARASPVERSLIAALAKRYPNSQPLDATQALPVLTAYAEAMGSVAREFPQDLDVQTLYAESLMNLNAWRLWGADGTAAPGTQQIVSILESVLARDPRHMGANHYYVHALEASPHPEKALASAARLPELAPSAAHLVHMPAHIFHPLGRYEEAAAANRQASLVDERYTARTHPPDYYPVAYTAHNYQFLAYSAAMEGRRAETLAATERSRQTASDDMLLDMPGMDWYVAESYAGLVRFGLWQEMLALPAPNPKLSGLVGGYMFGRAVALAATDHLSESRAALRQLRDFATSVPADALAGQNTMKDVLAVAIPMVEARIAEAEHRPQDAIPLLRRAVAAEDRLAYDEPKDWFFPVRHILGAALLRAGAAREAERVYREDLRKNRANGWSLCGLATALEGQGKAAEAAKIRKQFEEAWRHSDIVLTASAF